MKVLTLWQPWATLIATGVKRYETRSWCTPYRGLLLIHAAKRPLDSWGREMCRWAGLHTDLPFGAILCRVHLSCCLKTDWEIFPKRELAYGDFSPGRFAWQLEQLSRLHTPIPCVGRQGLFDAPPEVIAEVRRQARESCSE